VAGFDLRRYLDRFPEVCRKKFDRTYPLRALERDFQQLRSGKRWIVARDVLKIFDPARTPFARYWPAPSEKDLDLALSKQHLMLAPVPPGGREFVERLLAVFHNIGTVSLILRFAHPDRFGILSTPVVDLLQIHRPTTVELYVAFCDELRAWQEHFGLGTVAETEMALWAFHQIVGGRIYSPGDPEGRQAFDADVWIQRRRIAQALTPLLAKYGPLELAHILAEEHPKLAGMIAGVEFERLIRLKAHKFYGRKKRDRKNDVGGLIDEFARHGQIAWADGKELQGVWRARNKAVHPKPGLSSEEVEAMVASIERICLPWETST
jgi:hypothetical protein